MTAATVPAVKSLEALDFDEPIACESKRWPPLHPEDEAPPAVYYGTTHCRGPIPLCGTCTADGISRSGERSWCPVCGDAHIYDFRVLGPVRS